MTQIIKKIAGLDWQMIHEHIDKNGFANVTNLLTKEDCDKLITSYDDHRLYRKAISMERFRFGLGEYKYFNYPLPELIETIRQEVYARLVSIANSWMHILHINREYPQTFVEFQKFCHANYQMKPTVLILKYGKGGHNTLHQDLYGDSFFQSRRFYF